MPEVTPPAVVIGVDFDNTIVCYDELMHAIAVERGLIDPSVPAHKKIIRDTIRQRPGGESDWRGVQVTAYGPRLSEARPFDGVLEFFADCRRRGIPARIVSHKTEVANFGPADVNLRVAALAWLEQHGFLVTDVTGLDRASVFFEPTLADKLHRFRSVGATHVVDDLEETFGDEEFPAGVQKLLLAPHGQATTVAGVVSFATWAEVQRYVFDTPALPTLSTLLGKPVETVARVGAGGNNRVFAVTCADGSRYAVKRYLQPTADGRDRLQVEFSSLAFLSAHGVRSIARPVAADADGRLAAYEFIAGTPIEGATVTTEDVAQVAAFVGRLKSLAGEPGAAGMPPASEACFSLRALHDNLADRFARVQAAAGSEPSPEPSPEPSYDRLHAFLSQELAPVMAMVVSDVRAAVGDDGWTAELPQAERTLSPSDLGFHNALRRDDGSIVFLDFEYFGWDDPAKLLSDFLLHPAMSVSDSMRRTFVDRAVTALGAGETLRTRLARTFPLYALKWCLILLNEFVPTHLLRREFAAGARDREQVRLRQLAKAEQMLARAASRVVHV